MIKIPQLSDDQLARLVDNRWDSSSSVWDEIQKVYTRNLRIYKNEPEWLDQLPRKKAKVRANRIFVNVESVINTVIANPPQPLVLPGLNHADAKDIAYAQEKYFQTKFRERNVKEIYRKGLRNLYFSRLVVLKPFWDAKINDFNVRAIDPRKVRFGRKATKEDDSEFAIEEITDSLLSVMRRFPKKAALIMKRAGFDSEADALIMNPDVTYKEAWIREYVVFKYQEVILGVIRNPYWDWDGILITPEEANSLANDELSPEQRKTILQGAKKEQTNRSAALQQALAKEQPEAAAQQQPVEDEPAATGAQPTPTLTPEQPQQEAVPSNEVLPPDMLPQTEFSDETPSFKAYYFNHFDRPRKPYIFATLFNNENTPIGQTDMITQAFPLQESIDKRKRDISENAEIVNGIVKVDSSVMDEANAQKMRFEPQGIVYGKGVKDGVTRETGAALPAFVVADMQDSRSEVDNLMAASSAFRGEREGQETKAGRLALIDQSFLRLNEMVQVVDYLSFELFNWFAQLAKVRYTEHHYAKDLGENTAQKILTLSQEDFNDGMEVQVIGGKTLPTDREFRYEQAQADVQKGYISPVDYLQIAGYENPRELAKSAFMFRVAPASVIGLTDKERGSIPAPLPQSRMTESVSFSDLPPQAKVQWLQRQGIQVTEQQVVAFDVARAVLDNAARGKGAQADPNTEARAEADIEAGEEQQPEEQNEPAIPPAYNY